LIWEKSFSSLPNFSSFYTASVITGNAHNEPISSALPPIGDIAARSPRVGKVSAVLLDCPTDRENVP
jgi:hypothetical protein